MARWRQRKISVYDLDVKRWQNVEVKSDRYFLPFSRTVQIPQTLDFMSFGGLDDTEPEQHFFTNTGAMYTLFDIQGADSVCIPKPIRSMVKGRGCFSACYLHDFIYACGGINILEGVLSGCERYDVARDQWHEISDLNVARKNSSLCALAADSIFIFGGQNVDDRVTDVIEQYLVSANTWLRLPVKMHFRLSFLTTFKVSPYQILLLGGIVEGESEVIKENFITNQVSLYDIRYPEVTLIGELPSDFVSVSHPHFDDKGSLILVSEDDQTEYPKMIEYDINKFLANPKNTLVIE